ncbi:MAG TPA: hypothetical protein VFA87_09460, partial [Rhizomicrobium sp.]|nr:hypothetical protein [Rhizomicrobium sp.]
MLQTIRFAYGFTFGHLGTIIGLIWIPMVLVTAMGFFVMDRYVESFSAAIAQGNEAMAGQAGLLVIGYSIIGLLLYSVMYVAVTRQALGMRSTTAVAHFELGSPVWRMFGALLAVIFIIGIFYLVIFLVTLGGLAVIGGMGQTAATAGIALGLLLFVIAALCALLFVAVRLVFLLPPVVVAESRMSVSRGWELSRGNFWRIVLIWLATLVPPLLIVFGAELAILGPDYFFSGLNPVASLTDQANRMQE